MNVYKHLRPDVLKSENLPKIRVAYLFQVHGRSLRQIMRHLKWLYNDSDYFFFHVDSRSSYLHRSIKELESRSPQNIIVTDNRYATIWGGASLLKMIMSCLAEMQSRKWEMDYVINLSESDYILKKPSELKHFLSVHNGQNFVKSHGRDAATFIKKQGKIQRISEKFHTFVSTTSLFSHFRP